MKLIFTFLLGLITWTVQAQLPEETWHLGFKGGAAYSRVADLSTTIIRPGVFRGFSTEDQYRLGFVGGVFIHRRLANSFVAIQPEITYSMQGGGYDYTDSLGLNYGVDFNYQYINTGLLFKVYPVAGLHLMFGAQVGFNIANNKILYTSNQPELGPDLQIQQGLREVLRGSTDFNLPLGIGYEFGEDFPLVIEARFNLGLGDILQTQANGFGFIETPNKSRAFLLSLGWAIPFSQ
jgi:Outer membrane protein beta-barrel domain